MIEQVFKLSKKQYKAIRLLSDDSKCELLYGGAAGGGKSVLGCAWQIARRLSFPKSHGLIIRQTRKDFYSTVLITFNKVAELLNMGTGWSFTINEQKDEIQFSNGSIIFIRDGAFKPSDPQYDRLKLEVMDAWIEEGTQVDERAYVAIRPRIREYHGGSQSKLLITTNPGAGWIKRRFIKNNDGKQPTLEAHQFIIQALVSDNPDKEFAKNYAESLSQLDPVTKRMYLDGDWDVTINENQFFWALSREKHVVPEIEYNKRQRFILSFDFNIDPCTLLVSVLDMSTMQLQIIDHISANQYSIKDKSPLEAICEIFNTKYIKTGLCQRQNIVVTGDASGKNGSADRIANTSFYSTIKTSFQIMDGQIKLPNVNPPHKFSFEMINYVLSRLDNKCISIYYELTLLLNEIEASYPDDDTTLNKAKKELGLHAVDAFRYLIHYVYQYDKYKSIVEAITRKMKATLK